MRLQLLNKQIIDEREEGLANKAGAETAGFLSASYQSVPERTQNYNKDRSSSGYSDQIPVRRRNWGI